MTKIIKVNEIHLQEKDIVQITNYDDFIEINKTKFGGDTIFDLNGTLYLIAESIAYLHKQRGKYK